MKPASNLLPPPVVGRVPFDPVPGHPPGSTDAARARSLLAESGHLGYPIRFAYTSDVPGTNDVRTLPNKYLGWYVQDEFAIRPNLKVNLGLRYEFLTAMKDSKKPLSFHST